MTGHGHPLLCDKNITLSATLAATIGLEEAILLTVLNNAANLYEQPLVQIRSQVLRSQLPFWDDTTIHRVLTRLQEQGLVTIQGMLFPQADTLVYSFAETPCQQPATQARALPGAERQQPSQHSGHQWQPSADTLTRLQQHGIDRSFAMHQLDAFILKSQEQGRHRNDWNHRFFTHVKQQWVYTQNDAQKAQPTFGVRERHTFNISVDHATTMTPDWRPNEDAREILQRADIDVQFIEDAIPEFILYWSERGDAHKTWSSKFVHHVRQQWLRYTSSLEHSTKPTRIDSNWQPSADCFDIVTLAHIDLNFARALVPEFVLYWREANQLHTSWNSRFLQYVKQQWSRQLANSQYAISGTTNGQNTAQSGYATASASLERLRDTSWADG